MESIRQDLRYAIRSLRRRSTFAVIAIVTVGLAIGAATSIFSIVDGVLFRSLPYRSPGQLVSVSQTIPAWRKEPMLAAQWDRVVISYQAFAAWRDHQRSFSSVGVWTNGSTTLWNGNVAEYVNTTRVSPSLLGTLGVRPVVGRAFLPGEDVINGPRVLMLSYDAWQARFAGRADVVGAMVRLDTIPYQVVGVLPKGFTLVRGQVPPPFFVPAGQDAGNDTPNNHNYHAVGRLNPGVSVNVAAAEATPLLNGTYENPPRGVHIVALEFDQTREVRAPLLVLVAAVAMLLLVACVNIATLLVGEAAPREEEMATRIALGAGRGRLIRQLLTESLLLAVAGGMLGVVLSYWMTKGLVAIAPARVPGIAQAHVDARALVAALLVTTATGFLFGMIPALTLSRTAAARLIRGSSGAQSARGRGSLQRAMIATELALSVVLLVGAGLASRSLARLTSVEPGFRTDHLVAVRLAMPRSMARDEARTRARANDIYDRLRALPGIVAVTGASSAPFDGGTSSTTIKFENEADTNRPREVQQRTAQPDYFATMGIPLLSGRSFNESDREGSERVAVISESLARRDWPNSSPLGARVIYQGDVHTVVGVVGDVRFGRLSEDIQPTFYAAVAQRNQFPTFLIRTRTDPVAMIPSIRAALREVVTNMPVTSASAMDDRIRQSFGEERFRTILIDLFGMIALLLAAVGMYGVTARAVAGRTREVSIRVALGAPAGAVVRMIVATTLGGVTAGVSAGFVFSVGGSRVLAPYLYGVSPYDPTTYLGIFSVLAGVSLLASWLPARRAGRIDPAITLRGG
ncbi:MAG TPA: ABC transporter permease [Gemmatimonadaceae bacterium]|jgi:putative ABC transport system permease protein